MKKKRTLNQTWILCLRMWRWIAKVWTPNGLSVCELKSQWVIDNGFRNYEVYGNCFFCSLAESCWECPGRLIDPDFSCLNRDYDYEEKPVEFYKELLRLNRIRKAKNG